MVRQIDLFRNTDVPSVESGNAVLVFGGIDHKKFRKDVLDACEKYSFTNKPIAFGTQPTTKYTFMDLK